MVLVALLCPHADCAPESFIVDFTTGMGSFSVSVNRSWAPLGADHFYSLVEDGFYDDAAFFRVVPNFVVQFGIAGTPSNNVKWDTPIRDDPVKVSNRAGTLVYATSGPNSRTTQVFINYVPNAGLDRQGFAPFGQIDAAGLAIVEKVFNPTPASPQGVDQTQYKARGNAWIRQKYPGVTFITKATVRNLAPAKPLAPSAPPAPPSPPVSPPVPLSRMQARYEHLLFSSACTASGM